jgi:hypothetical protein
VGLSLQAGSEDERELAIPRPTRAALPVAALGLVPLALAAGGLLPRSAGLVVAAGCVLLSLVRGSLALLDLSNLRRAADDLLRAGVRAHPQSALLSWRSAELTSDRNRKINARSLRAIARELDGRSLPSAVPLNRAGARPYAEVIRLLAGRLEDLQRAVSARGVLLVQDLLTDGIGSPLYVRARSSELRATLERCLTALDSPGSPRFREPLSSRSNGSHRTGSSDQYVASVLVDGKR